MKQNPFRIGKQKWVKIRFANLEREAIPICCNASGKHGYLFIFCFMTSFERYLILWNVLVLYQ